MRTKRKAKRGAVEWKGTGALRRKRTHLLEREKGRWRKTGEIHRRTRTIQRRRRTHLVERGKGPWGKTCLAKRRLRPPSTAKVSRTQRRKPLQKDGSDPLEDEDDPIE